MYQLVFGSNTVDLFQWGDDGEDLCCTQDNSLSGQFAQQWKLRMMAQGLAPKEVAEATKRRLPAKNKSFNCTPRRRGQAKILDIDDAGVTVKSQSQTYKVAPYCVGDTMDA